MAKLGEGDPRWLVTNREDGKNVNNWHWSEQNLYAWLKDKLTSLFENKVIAENGEGKVWISQLDNLTGDVFMNNRKGKRKYLWDLSMTLQWCGKLKAWEVTAPEKAPRVVKGKVECSEISVIDDDFSVKVMVDDKDNSDSDGLKLHSMVKKSAEGVVRTVFKSAVDEMISKHQDPVPMSPKSGDTDVGASSSSKAAPSTVAATQQQVQESSSHNSSSSQSSDFRQTIEFSIPPVVLFETLLDAQRVSAFTGSHAQISNQEGSAFSLFNGNVSGFIQELVPSSKIVQKWRFSNWPEEHYSLVTIDLKDTAKKGSRVVLTQSNIPTSDATRTSSGWESHFWRGIQGVFGWDFEILR